MSSVINYRLLDIQDLPELARWIIARKHLGADVAWTHRFYSVWAIIPESMLDEFISNWGDRVSAV